MANLEKQKLGMISRIILNMMESVAQFLTRIEMNYSLCPVLFPLFLSLSPSLPLSLPLSLSLSLLFLYPSLSLCPITLCPRSLSPLSLPLFLSATISPSFSLPLSLSPFSLSLSFSLPHHSLPPLSLPLSYFANVCRHNTQVCFSLLHVKYRIKIEIEFDTTVGFPTFIHRETFCLKIDSHAIWIFLYILFHEKFIIFEKKKTTTQKRPPLTWLM